MLRMMQIFITTLVLLGGTATTAWSEKRKPLPPHLQHCFDRAVKALLITDHRDKQAMWKLFLAHTDRERLGQYNYMRAWRNHPSKTWRDMAIALLFQTLYDMGQKSSHGVDVNKVSVSAGLAYYPTRVQADEYQVITKINFGNGDPPLGVVLRITKQCKAFGFQQGFDLRSTVDADAVERALKAKSR